MRMYTGQQRLLIGFIAIWRKLIRNVHEISLEAVHGFDRGGGEGMDSEEKKEKGII